MAQINRPAEAAVAGPDPRAALDAAIDAARLAAPLVALPHGAARLLVPQGYRLEAVDDPHALPPHPIAEVVVDDRASLSAYVNRFSDNRSVLLADVDAGVVAALLDYHAADGAPGPMRHRAVLRLRPSEEFKRWNALNGKLQGQAEFAAFLEENAQDIVDPEPAVMIEISRDMEATQGVTFKSSTRLENGDRAFVYETETRARDQMRIPREFRVSIPLYEGEEPVEIRCAFRFRIQPAGLALGFEWRRVEYQRLALFRQIAFAVAEETGRPAMFGRLGAA